MPEPVSSRSFYRIVLTNPATISDFISNAAAGRALRRPNEGEAARLWDGISVLDSVERARQRALRQPQLGQFVAILEIPAEAPVRVERTRGPGHLTLWADPDELLSRVVSVVAVEEDAG